jgi:hypothetical protein
LLNFPRQLLRALPSPDLFGLVVPKTDNHLRNE